MTSALFPVYFNVSPSTIPAGEAVQYCDSFHCFREVIAAEGWRSLFKGAGANILRAVAGAGALAGYDRLQLIMFGRVYEGD